MENEYSYQILTIDPVEILPDPEYDPLTISLSGNPLEKTPVLQLFCTSISGQKECLIYHGLFPTIYVDCPDNIEEHSLFQESLLIFIKKKFQTPEIIYSFKVIRSISIFGYNHESFLKHYNHLLIQNFHILNKILLTYLKQLHLPHIYLLP